MFKIVSQNKVTYFRLEDVVSVEIDTLKESDSLVIVTATLTNGKSMIFKIAKETKEFKQMVKELGL